MGKGVRQPENGVGLVDLALLKFAVLVLASLKLVALVFRLPLLRGCAIKTRVRVRLKIAFLRACWCARAGRCGADSARIRRLGRNACAQNLARFRWCIGQTRAGRLGARQGFRCAYKAAGQIGDNRATAQQIRAGQRLLMLIARRVRLGRRLVLSRGRCCARIGLAQGFRQRVHAWCCANRQAGWQRQPEKHWQTACGWFGQNRCFARTNRAGRLR